MKWVKTMVTFDSPDPESAAALITDIFCNLGLQGVIVEGPDNTPGLDWAEDAMPQQEKNAVIGFFRADRHLEKNRRLLKEKLSGLPKAIAGDFQIAYSDIDEQDWAESWKAHFHPVRISKRLVVKPSWRNFAAGNQDIIIEIDPGMAFGTGTHPTTALCMQLIERHLRPGACMLDVGTGSGILLLTAAKLGAGMLYGIDCDPVAVDVAGQNLLANHISPARFHLGTGDLVSDVERKFDIIAANILTQTILPMIPQIPGLLTGDKIFIASGIVAQSKDRVVAGLEKQGFEVIEILSEDEWVAIAAKII